MQRILRAVHSKRGLPLVIARATLLALMLASFPGLTSASQYYSYPYTVKDGSGKYYHVMGMVSYTLYSDHIYANSFWLNIYRRDGAQPPAVCSQYYWSRNAPGPYNGSHWNDGSPFPIYDNPTWDYWTFNQDMYWGSSTPIQIHLETSSVDVCGTPGGSWESAGVAIYRFSTYWYDQAITN